MELRRREPARKPVEEPEAALLLGFGLAGVVIRSRRSLCAAEFDRLSCKCAGTLPTTQNWPNYVRSAIANVRRVRDGSCTRRHLGRALPAGR
jgi:hypothetical protein